MYLKPYVELCAAKNENEMGRQRSDDERSLIPYTCWCLIDEVS